MSDDLRPAPHDHDLGGDRHETSESRLAVWPPLAEPDVQVAPYENLSLPGERRVAVVGDWESQPQLVLPLLARLRRVAPDVRTILHVGDLRWSPRTGSRRGHGVAATFGEWLDEQLVGLDFTRLILVPGNHDSWAGLQHVFAANPTRFFRPTEHIWIAPRGMLFTLADRRYLCMGGAASLHADGGPLEAPRDDEVRRAAGAGQVDVLLTHEALNVGISEVDNIVMRQRKFAATRRAASAESRERVTWLYEQVAPKLAFFGHMHVAGSTTTRFGDVHCLNVVRKRRHVAILTLNTLSVSWLDDLPDPGQPPSS